MPSPYRSAHLRVPSLVRKNLKSSDPSQPSTPSTSSDSFLSSRTRRTARRLLWTYARLLCSSSCYIAGLAFYNALNGLLTDSTNGLQMIISATSTKDDIVATNAKQRATTGKTSTERQNQAYQTGEQHSWIVDFISNPLVIRWLVSIGVMIFVIIFVKKLVMLSEKQFVYQVRRENDALKRAYAMKKQQHLSKHKDNENHNDKQAILSTTSHDRDGKNGYGSGLPQSTLQGSKVQSTQRCLICNNDHMECGGQHFSATDSPFIAFSPGSSPLDEEEQRVHTSHSVDDIHLKLQPSVLFQDNAANGDAAMTDRKSTQLVTIHPVDVPSYNDNNNPNTLDTVAKRREYMAEWRSARRNVYRQKLLFFYRLADMLAYYLVFVAVYSLQSTLQLSLPLNSIGLQWIYFMIIAVCSYSAASFLTAKNRSYVERLTHSHTCEEHDRLRVKQGIQRKLSSYTASSLSYLLAYAAWNAIQTTLIGSAAKHTRQHVWFVWLTMSSIMMVGTAIIVLLNVRIYSEVLPSETDSTIGGRAIHNLFGLLSHICCTACNPLSSRPISTSRLHVRVDILDGSTIHTPSQQVGTEGMSYIAALSIGAAVAAAIPAAAPIDDSTYLRKPTLHGLALYALTISFLAAALTAVLETLLNKLSTKHQAETSQAVKALTSSKSNESLASIRSTSSDHLYDDTTGDDYFDLGKHIHGIEELHREMHKRNLHVQTGKQKSQSDGTAEGSSTASAAGTGTATARNSIGTRTRQATRDYLDVLNADEFGDDADAEEEESALSEVEEEEQAMHQRRQAIVAQANSKHQQLKHKPPSINTESQQHDATPTATSTGSVTASASVWKLYPSPRFKSTVASSAVLDTIITISSNDRQTPASSTSTDGGKKAKHKSGLSICVDLQPLMPKSQPPAQQQSSLSTFSRPPKSPSISRQINHVAQAKHAKKIADVNISASASPSPSPKPRAAAALLQSTVKEVNADHDTHNRESNSNLIQLLSPSPPPPDAFSASAANTESNDLSVQSASSSEPSSTSVSVSGSPPDGRHQVSPPLKEIVITSPSPSPPPLSKANSVDAPTSSSSPLAASIHKEHHHGGDDEAASRDPSLLLSMPAPSLTRSVAQHGIAIHGISSSSSSSDLNESDSLLGMNRSSRDNQHRLLLARTFIHEWYVALVATCVQGLSLMCAYGWVGLLYFGVLPGVGLDTSHESTAWVFAIASFIWYASLTAFSAKFLTHT